MNCPTCGCPVPVERTEAEEKAIREAVPYIVVKTVAGDQAIPDRTAAQWQEGRG